MAAQWCTLTDMFDQAPELQNDGIMGIVQPATFERYIERATQKVKHSIQGRYTLSQFGDIPASVPYSIETFTAVQAAYMALQGRITGEAGKAREEILAKDLLFWTTQAANGSLLADDNSLIPNSQAITNGPGDTGMTLVDDLYPIGVSRYGVYNDSLTGFSRRFGGDWQ